MSALGTAVVELKSRSNLEGNDIGGSKVKKVSAARKIISRCHRHWCTKKTIKRCLPFVTWLPNYSKIDLRGDIIAGTTVALTLIPQSLAYAQLAALPPQYGLYTAFMGCFVYAVFGSSKDLCIGPAAVISLMISQYVYIGGIQYAILLSLLSGCIQLVMGLLNLGYLRGGGCGVHTISLLVQAYAWTNKEIVSPSWKFIVTPNWKFTWYLFFGLTISLLVHRNCFLVNFISAPVLSGFISAAAIIIAVSQLPGLFGLKFEAHGFVDTIYQLCLNIPKTNYWDFIMGSSSIIILLLLRHFKNSKISRNSKLPLSGKKIIDGTWWTIAIGRNAIVVVLCAGIAYSLKSHDITVLTLTQEIKAGLPSFTVPKFTVESYNNITNTTTYKDFMDIMGELEFGILVIPVVSVIEAIAIAKAFAKGKKLNATQEIIALGFCNILGSFVSSYPTTASFSRSAINNTSGVRTPLAAIITGAYVLLALGVLAPCFEYIPKASLCAIVFSAVIFMVHYQDVLSIWKSNKIDLLPLCTTFILCFVWGVEHGIVIGAGISLVIYLYQQSQLKLNIRIVVMPEGIVCMFVKPDKNILYPSIEYVSSKLTKEVLAATKVTPPDVIVFDGEILTKADYTTAVGIKHLMESLKSRNIIIVFINLKEEVIQIFERSQPPYFYCCKNNEEFEIFIAENIQSKQTIKSPHVPEKLKSDTPPNGVVLSETVVPPNETELAQLCEETLLTVNDDKKVETVSSQL